MLLEEERKRRRKKKRVEKEEKDKLGKKVRRENIINFEENTKFLKKIKVNIKPVNILY